MKKIIESKLPLMRLDRPPLYSYTCSRCNNSVETKFNNFCYHCWYIDITHTPYGAKRDIYMDLIIIVKDVLWENSLEVLYKDIKDCIFIRDEQEDNDGLTNEERKAMLHLSEAWNHFAKLPIQHNDDISEFKHAVHRLQHLIMIRPTRRNYSDYTNELRDKK